MVVTLTSELWLWGDGEREWWWGLGWQSCANLYFVVSKLCKIIRVNSLDGEAERTTWYWWDVWNDSLSTSVCTILLCNLYYLVYVSHVWKWKCRPIRHISISCLRLRLRCWPDWESVRGLQFCGERERGLPTLLISQSTLHSRRVTSLARQGLK